MKKGKGFTLIELLIVIAIIAIITAIVFAAIKPDKNLKNAQNARRWLEIDSLANAVKQYQVDTSGDNPAGLDSTLRMIGTDLTGCSVDCGSTSEIYYHNQAETINYYSNNTYTARNWFSVNAADFSALTVAAVLDCDGSCTGQVRVRIGNATSYNDYDFVNAASVRTDGTKTNYSWYENVYPISKSSLGNYFFVQLLKYTGSGTMKFLMDEVGPLGPDPEFRQDNNGDGSQAGWTKDNGDYFIKIGVPERTADACLNLDSSLVDRYFKSIPVDAKYGSPEQTFYAIKETAAGNIKVVACKAENNEEIEISR